MEDADIDVLDDIQEPETAVEDTSAAPKRFLLMPFIGLFFLLFAFFMIASNTGSRGANANIGPTQAALSYQSLSDETHTGLRLARLDDFLAQYSDSAYSLSARSRRDALKVHEEKAWADLTDAFYDTEADEEIKTAAVKTYTDKWTPLHRPEQLKALDQVLPNDAVPNFNPNNRKSRFASGGNDKFLEGGPVVRIPTRRPVVTRPPEIERIARSRVVEPRIRGKARRPSYPSRAKRRRIEADVVLELDIDDKGRVRQTRVVSVSADRYAKDFVRAAERAARRTRFYPQTVAGKPVPMSGHLQKYAFRTSR